MPKAKLIRSEKAQVAVVMSGQRQQDKVDVRPIVCATEQSPAGRAPAFGGDDRPGPDMALPYTFAQDMEFWRSRVRKERKAASKRPSCHISGSSAQQHTRALVMDARRTEPLSARRPGPVFSSFQPITAKIPNFGSLRILASSSIDDAKFLVH
eukprot:CAMPEP_0119314570 /NCGR_PEP_ID=MMETSP1333-20130426/33201_1 /TAXON_ID=418940 /ORGANISM="Scyphosphaera apsteinii, Strain RCC1455" /LENGTH=152 /DNA_ID=CAMNT_0007319707 /DNA_START=192 /DNA_END=651 /DNA_ORIENTATION=+